MIVFSHGNSFPAGTYSVLIDSLRERGFDVRFLEKFGHNPRFPVTDNWPHVEEELSEFVGALVASRQGHPVWLVGHSLGGLVSLMTAGKHPDWVRGVVLLDSPVLAGWKSAALGVAKTIPLMGKFSPGAVSRKRRNSWPDADAVLEHFRHKRAFAKWDPQVLLDYVRFGTHDAQGKRVLTFDRDIETRFYNTVPDHLPRYLRQHPLKCPVTFIGGSHSVERRQVGMDFVEHITKGRTMMLDGSHLFPMEKPLATAAAVEAALRNMGA
ncbi:alpha/beta hydrolase [Curvibacter sp. APW13]|uniref:alpha/beta hydrolase n=1 Tax=Curvibacter sp. APW13 TaxID=3077236 RepID=UPI0028DF7989|nr:alpha/beta hydrolase [Curvibacter sp. APW13]MDT8991072.1 alpha/beta hydrolase [Curvibacter sp. APW13]